MSAPPPKNTRAAGNGSVTSAPLYVALRVFLRLSLPSEMFDAVKGDELLVDQHVAVVVPPSAQFE
jgi:hypothetical protein